MPINKLRRGLRQIINRWIFSADGAQLAQRYETARKLRPNLNVALTYTDDVFVLDNGTQALAVARKERLHFSILDIERRQAALWRDYLVQDGMIGPGDMVVDCGANIGEFSILCAKRGARVFSFEPDRREFSALRWNAENKEITAFPYALWREKATLDFFDCNDDGDSSLIDPGDAAQTYQVEAMPLDAVADVPDGPIKLIKLEAEGAEPEIIDGMPETLKRTSYITVDMGPERGISKDNTVVEVNTRLSALGFQLIGFNPGRCIGLYQRLTSEADAPDAAETAQAGPRIA